MKIPPWCVPGYAGILTFMCGHPCPLYNKQVTRLSWMAAS
ncbi:hypothetical protein HMPREF0908_1575 [Selenomonas flueggei ATCC 43531]|uniref:Uncharacterized protein n=1 Tax=Selenomonas flueggei ATCC 43531 TaxID=638302 RepID=C4V4Y1_9FIRM|nr:hypothetical protein HMPREF0908_1575 [Selenomonas flueggei ATCC 43531]